MRKIHFKKPRFKKQFKPLRPRGIYIIPSLFTCGNMTFGFLSMIHSINGHFTASAWFIVGAIACDILDGRIARITKSTSDFGMQLDSLSDLVSFGIAPAMMMFELVLKNHPLTHGKIGVAIAVLFVLCSALRLAKFNVQAAKGIVYASFRGLPTPASAGVIISFVLSYDLWLSLNAPEELLQKYPAELAALNFKTIPILLKAMPKFFAAMPVVMIVLSFLMVSNVPYISFKKLHISKPVALRLLVLIIILLILVVVFPQNIFFVIFCAYAVSGIIMLVPNAIIKNHQKKNKNNTEIHE